MYPIQAPLSVTQNAPALAFMWFLSSFAGVSIPIPFHTYLCSHSLNAAATSSVGLGYHDRRHCHPERACEEAPRVIYSICPTGDRHHVRAHPPALHVPPAD